MNHAFCSSADDAGMELDIQFRFKEANINGSGGIEVLTGSLDNASPDFQCFAFLTTECGLEPVDGVVADFDLTCDATGFATILEKPSITFADAVGGESAASMALELRDAEGTALMCCTFTEERERTNEGEASEEADPPARLLDDSGSSSGSASGSSSSGDSGSSSSDESSSGGGAPERRLDDFDQN